jgi:RND family efflux transporter MFP subunit
MKHSIITEILFSIFAASFVFGCGEKIDSGHTPPKSAKRVVASIAVAKSTFKPFNYEAVGTVIARTQATLSGKLMGTIQVVQVKEGDHVKAGDLLVSIDERQVNAMLDQASAALDEARRGEAAAESARQAARSARDLAKTTHNRYTRLLESESVSRQEFDEVESRYRQTEAFLEQAEAMLQAARHRVKQAAAGFDAASTGKADARILAPYAGKISRKMINPGDLGSPGMPFLVIEKEGFYDAQVRVPETHIHRVRLQQKVDLSIPGTGDALLKGIIVQILPGADEQSRSFEVKIQLPQNSHIRSGMFVRVSIPLEEERIFTVPKSALVFQGQLSGIFVLDESNSARFRLVRTGRDLIDSVEILSGIQEGVRFVSLPPPDLENGMKVEVAP